MDSHGVLIPLLVAGGGGGQGRYSLSSAQQANITIVNAKGGNNGSTRVGISGRSLPRGAGLLIFGPFL